MTTVEVWRDDRGVSGLRVSGHADYAPEGEDIVCAAASVLITTCANAMESVAGIRPLVRQSRQPAELSVALPSGFPREREHDARVILQTALRGFQDIAERYPQYLQII